MTSKTNNMLTPTDENATLTVAQVMQEVNYKQDLSDLRSRLTAIASPAKSRMSDEQTEQLAEKNVPALEKTQMGIAITKACRGFYAEALRYARDNGHWAAEKTFTESEVKAMLSELARHSIIFLTTDDYLSHMGGWGDDEDQPVSGRCFYAEAS